jgi:hypothetical protein
MLDTMLNQLIFLGQVPGTNFFITFTELLIVFEVALVVFLFRKKRLLVRIGRRIRFYELYLQVYLLTDRAKELRLPV